jgi:hypothetical protein
MTQPGDHVVVASALFALAALLVCFLVIRYGFTRDSEPAGRWGWKPTRLGHAVAAALFGTGVVLAVLALTAMPLGGMEGYGRFADRLTERIESLRTRLAAIDRVVESLRERSVHARRAALPSEPTAVAPPSGAGGPALRAPASPQTKVTSSLSSAPAFEAPPVRSAMPAPRQASVPAAESEPPAPPRYDIAARREKRADMTADRKPSPDGAETARIEPVERHPRVPRSSLGERVDERGGANLSEWVAGRRAELAERGNSAKAMRAERVEPPDRMGTPIRVERLERAQRPERVERAERPERPERPERAERAERVERAERPERPERPERAERPERFDRIERVGRIERPERVERFERGDRMERVERMERRGR